MTPGKRTSRTFEEDSEKPHRETRRRVPHPYNPAKENTLLRYLNIFAILQHRLPVQ